MSDHDPFLRTIAERPADDGPRLVYADWLEEQGDADRAEFIRLQIDLARTEDDDDATHPAKEERVEELLAAHWFEWLAPVCAALGERVPHALGTAPPSEPRSRLGRAALGVLRTVFPSEFRQPGPDDYTRHDVWVFSKRGRVAPHGGLTVAGFKRGFPDVLTL